MDNAISMLKEWGCDIDGAMARFLDDEEFYIEMLTNLCADEGYAALGRAIEKGDAAEAFDRAHTLKGVIGNMGITPMFNAVCDIVEPLRHGEWTNVRESYAVLGEQFIKVKGMLKR